MLKPVVFAVTAGFSIAAFCQPTQPQAQKEQPVMSSASAGAGASQRCDVMSREDMRMCQVNKPGADVRSPLCDQVSSRLIESCLQQPQSASSGASRESTDRNDAKAAK